MTKEKQYRGYIIKPVDEPWMKTYGHYQFYKDLPGTTASFANSEGHAEVLIDLELEDKMKRNAD